MVDKLKVIENLNKIINNIILKIYLNKGNKIFKETINKLPVKYSQQLIDIGLKINQRADIYRNDNSMLFLFLDRNISLFNKVKNKIANDIETNSKREYYEKLINEARNHDRIFYLCSKHLDCAKDHLNYQGRIYIDNAWDAINYSDKIKTFITNNNILTIQSVTEQSPYLLFRPNCRHYLKSINTEKALNMSEDELLEHYGMIHEVGPRVTIKEINIKCRLSLYKDMYRHSKNVLIKNKIKIYLQLLENMQ